MATRIVEVDPWRYTVALDDGVPPRQRFWGVVQARAVDELTGHPPSVAIRLEAHTRGFTPRVAAGGLIGLVARPDVVFPKLAEQSYAVPFSIEADGFIPRHEEVTVPATALYPIRTIDPATDPGPGDATLTLGSVDGITAGETLLVGRPGNRERVGVQSVNAAAEQVTVTPPLSSDHRGGDPVVVEELVPFDPSTSVLDVGDLALHRRPVVLAGRTIRRNNGTITPVPNATVTVTGLWRQLVPAAVEPPAEAPTLVSLDPPLYAARASATGRVRRREMVPVAGEDKTLLAWTDARTADLRLSDQVNLSPGDVLLVDADPAVQEYVTIDAIAGTGASDLPATVTLTHGLAHAHRGGARVQRATPQAPGPNRQLSHDAIAGDTCLFLNSLSGLAGVEVVEVFGGSAPPEFHRLHLFTVTSDADGQYRLPPLSRAAKLELEATDGADTAGPVLFVPDYTRRENRLDIAF